MSSRLSWGAPSRGRRRKTTPTIDLNSVPPGENRDNQEGTSTQVRAQNSQSFQGQNFDAPPTIDVEAIDDDVIESSPRAFAAAKNNRRNRRPSVVIVEDESTRANYNPKRRRTTQNQSVIINLESSGVSKVKKPAAPTPPPPPKEPTFNCPICMSTMVEEMTTKCGHIFCKGCIKAAIAAQAKCPTCRKRVTVKELIRVFLPSTTC